VNKEFKLEKGDLRPVLGVGGTDDDTIVRLRNAAMMEDTVDGGVCGSQTAYAAGPGDWLASLTSAERKEVAVSRGLQAYFPDALALVARHSVRSNEKHNPGQHVHWSREKSSDHEDCVGRHSIAISINPDSLDGDAPHMVCRAWRALAALQLWAEEQVRKGRKV
jgi:hypothetical protein